VVGLSCVLGFGCAASSSYRAQTYVVRPQDTLYSIAWRYDLDYRELARWNNIGPDYRIAVGQLLSLKPTSGGPAPRPPPNIVAAPHDVPRVTPPRPQNAPAAGTGSAPVSSAAAPRSGIVGG